MMRAFYIIGILLSFAINIVTVIFAVASESAKRSYYWNYSYDEDYSSRMYELDRAYARASEITFVGACTMIVFVLFFFMLYILSLIKIKTRTALVFSILGLVFTALASVVVALMMADPREFRFDEAGFAMLPYGLLMIAFTIVGTVHAFKTRT